jgi:hypothetical protein
MGQPNKRQTLKTKDWRMPENSFPGENCTRNRPIVDKGKFLLPPLHIKLGLMKNFVKAVNKHGKGFEYLREKFPKLGDSKFKKGIFIRPQIREIVNDDLYEHLLTETEKSAWLTLQAVCLKFLRSIQAERFIFYIPTRTSSLRTWLQ